MIKEIAFKDEFNQELKKAVGIEYRQRNSSTATVLAIFGKQPFNKISIATTLNNKIKIVGAVAMSISRSESEVFIKHLTTRYGAFTKLKGEFGRVFDIYEWETKDRTFRYAPVFNDENNSLKIDIGRTDKTNNPEKKEPHLEGYLYIIKTEFAKDISKTKTGDFAYLNTD